MDRFLSQGSDVGLNRLVDFTDQLLLLFFFSVGVLVLVRGSFFVLLCVLQLVILLVVLLLLLLLMLEVLRVLIFNFLSLFYPFLALLTLIWLVLFPIIFIEILLIWLLLSQLLMLIVLVVLIVGWELLVLAAGGGGVGLVYVLNRGLVLYHHGALLLLELRRVALGNEVGRGVGFLVNLLLLLLLEELLLLLLLVMLRLLTAFSMVESSQVDALVHVSGLLLLQHGGVLEILGGTLGVLLLHAHNVALVKGIVCHLVGHLHHGLLLLLFPLRLLLLLSIPKLLLLLLMRLLLSRLLVLIITLPRFLVIRDALVPSLGLHRRGVGHEVLLSVGRDLLLVAVLLGVAGIGVGKGGEGALASLEGHALGHVILVLAVEVVRLLLLLLLLLVGGAEWALFLRREGLGHLAFVDILSVFVFFVSALIFRVYYVLAPLRTLVKLTL
jgi:hypothetical protein